MMNGKRIYVNTIANLSGVMWQGILVLLMAPVYLRLLGKEQWGLVAACLSLQGVLLLLDAGMSQVMPRDFAKNKGASKDIYFNYLCLYFFVGILAVVILFSTANFIATNWFELDNILAEKLIFAIKLFSGQFFFQFCNNVNLAYWNGNEEQIKTNISQCFFLSLKHLLAVILIFTTYREIYVYLLAFFIVSTVEFFVNYLIINKGGGGHM